MFASTINLTIFIMMIVIYLNEMRNITTFIFNFNYIKDLSKIIMNEKCNNIYCEAETDRYNIAKNSYKLLLPNDIFNSKTYIIFTFIVSIMIFIYYYYLLFGGSSGSSGSGGGYYYVLNLLLLAILLGIIIYRYVPNDEAGYLNYFGKIEEGNSSYMFQIYLFGLFIAITRIIYLIKREELSGGIFIILVKYACFIYAIILLINLMNIVMTFRSNTTPILKTKMLGGSLKYSFKILLDKFTEDEKAKLKAAIGDEYNIVDSLLTSGWLDTNDIDSTTISSVLNILIAFDELTKIILGGYGNDETNIKYIFDLQKIMKDNNDKISIGVDKANITTVSEISLSYDKIVKIPHNYDSNDHGTNNNKFNTDYVYTADISYDNANLYYEKYWDLNAKTDAFFYSFGYDYFAPTYLLGGYRPNLFRILLFIVIFIIGVYIVGLIVKIFQPDLLISKLYSELSTILYPFIMLVILIIYILLFIRFNTKFNSNVIYKCLDCSYKRSLNKLNNIVTPYIRMYDNKIIRGNKNYIKHYIITNVFYSILSGNIKLCNIRGGLYTSVKNVNTTLLELKNAFDILPKSQTVTQPQIDNIKAIAGRAPTIVQTAIDITIVAGITKSVANLNTIKSELATIISTLRTNNIASIKNKVYTISSLSADVLREVNTPIKSIINEDEENATYYDIPRIKSNRLKLSIMNNSILSNDNEFREYYKAKFENLYKEDYNTKHVTSIYNVFIHLFKCNSQPDTILNSEADIDTYFKGLISRDNIIKIYCIIKKCFDLFNEEKFNSNLIYYNNHENKQKGINIDNYNKFKFYKYGDQIIPYKFILKLNTLEDYEEFVKDIKTSATTELETNITDYFDNSNYTNILIDNLDDEEEASSQVSDIQKKQNKNLIKLVARYLLILGHINYNRIEYNIATNTEAIKRDIYEKKTYYLYKLFSNILYDDTYEIDDTFNVNSNGIQNTTIVSIAVTSGGSGYTSLPSININPVGGAGTGAEARAVLKPTSVDRIIVRNGGSGYTKAPTITITGGGDDSKKTYASATAVLEGSIISAINITGKGSGYTSVPTIAIGTDGGGIGAIAEAILMPTSIESVLVTNRGTGYTNIPTVDITGGGGSGATTVALNSLLINDGIYEKYKRLTYIYNYLETKYVNISSNNNKNYLMNTIKSINNKINDEDKTLNTDSKSTRYLFSKAVYDMKNPRDYEIEDEILNTANSVSTSTFASTYIINIILLIIYFNIISTNIK